MIASAKSRITCLLLLGLAAYCVYHTLIFFYLSFFPHAETWEYTVPLLDRLAVISLLGWAIYISYACGIYLFSVMAYKTYRKDVDSNITEVNLFPLFCGIFAGLQTYLVWQCLSSFFIGPEGYLAGVYPWLLESLVCTSAALFVGFSVTRLSRNGRGIRQMVIAFGAASVATLVYSLIGGPANLHPAVALACGAFLIFAYFFPSAAGVLVTMAFSALNMLMMLFLAIFAIVGGISSSRR